MEVLYGIFLLLGGIGLFLYGINYMTASLKAFAGDKLRSALEKMTKKPFLAFLTGIFVTALIQSSGATSVMVVGFVNAGLMEMSRALYVMLGANIGTTITAQIIAFKVERIAPLFLFLGVVFTTFVRGRTVKKAGSIVLGFGMLFVGIYLVGTASSALNLSAVIKTFLANFSNPLLSLLFGFAITAIIQSSSASIGILQVLLASSAAESFGLSSVFYMILGMNIGAASPVVIASFGASRGSKRAALSSVAAKVIGTALFLLVTLLFPLLANTTAVAFIEKLSPGDITRQIANLHLFFNLISSLLTLPLVKLITAFSYKCFPELPEMEMEAQKLLYLSPEVLLNPSIAVAQAKREILRMAHLAKENLKLSLHAFFESDEDETERVYEREKTINYLNHEITGVLIALHGKNLSPHDLESLGMMFHVTSDVERLGDHAENVADYTVQIGGAKLPTLFSEPAIEELHTIADKTMLVVEMAIEAYDHEKFDMLPAISDAEEEVDQLQETLIAHHIERLKNDQCDPQGGVIFTDLVTDLERCADHAINIAYAINGEKSTVAVKKYIITRGEEND